MLQEELILPGQEPPGIEQEIIDTIGSFAVALFGIDRREKRENRVNLRGSGTLVSINDDHYILTAAHVWLGGASKPGLKQFPEIGMTLKAGVENRFAIPTDKIIPAVIIPDDERWNEWGPDLALLRIPAPFSGTIKANRNFYNLTRERDLPVLDGDYRITFLFGAPKAHEEVSQQIPTEQIGAYFGLPEPTQIKGDFDFFDLKANLSSPGIPENFEGVSGGGFWQAILRTEPSSGKPQSVCWRLEGVAFFQFEPVENYRIIRCHGMRSIERMRDKTLI